jgi:hypothetical protein
VFRHGDRIQDEKDRNGVKEGFAPETYREDEKSTKQDNKGKGNGRGKDKINVLLLILCICLTIVVLLLGLPMYLKRRSQRTKEEPNQAYEG